MKQNYLGTYGVLKGSYMESRLKYYDFESTKKAYGDPTSTILKCVRDDKNEEYILVELLTTNEKMRIKREEYELTSKPKFDIGDKVKLIKYPDKKATVRKIYWHDKDKRIYYLLDVENDKRKSVSRYYEDDNKFEKV